MNHEDLAFTPLHEQARLITRGDVSPVELTEIYLDRISDYDEALGAYLAVTADRALAMAQAAETTLVAGSRRGPLHGIPLVLKDLFDVGGMATTGGAVGLADNIAERDATVARRLFEAGAVLLGKAHMVEVAFGGTGINHHYGTPWNPWDPDVHRLPGGSSSGSAVAVASAMASVALGSDTGGSVRIPASFCGLVGLKPTFGRVSSAGVLPLDPTLDSVGPIARCGTDVALVYDSIAGGDRHVLVLGKRVDLNRVVVRRFGGRDGHNEEDENLPGHAVQPGERHERQVDGVELKLDAQEHDDGVPTHEHAQGTNHEQEGAENERFDAHATFFLASTSAPTMATSSKMPVISKGTTYVV